MFNLSALNEASMEASRFACAASLRMRFSSAGMTGREGFAFNHVFFWNGGSVELAWCDCA